MPPRKKTTKPSVDVPQPVCPAQSVPSVVFPAGEPFEVILNKSVLKTILEAASKTKTESIQIPVLTMRWGVDGMSAIGMDESHISLLHCFLPPQAFQAYACHDAPVFFDVRVASLVQVLNRIDDAHDTVLIRVDMGDTPHRTERRAFNTLMSGEDRCAYRIATSVLNVSAFDDATRTAEGHFVTWDALGDVMHFLAEEESVAPWRDSPGGPPSLTLGAKTVGSRTVTSQFTLPVDAPTHESEFHNVLVVYSFTATVSMPSREFANFCCQDGHAWSNGISFTVKCGPTPSISMSVVYEDYPSVGMELSERWDA